MAAFNAVSGGGGARKSLQTRPRSFLVFAVDRTRRPRLLAQLRNCRGQGRVLFAGIYFDAIAAGLGIGWLIQFVASRRSPIWKPYVVAATAIVLSSAAAFAANWPFNNRRHYFIAADYVENLFTTIAPNGLMLTQDWQVASPMLYAQE